MKEDREMMLPTFMIIESFRYVLGRMTYAVSMWTNWIVENWDKIPEYDQNTIIIELEEAFKRDDAERKKDLYQHKTLGHDCDRVDWEKVRALWKE